MYGYFDKSRLGWFRESVIKRREVWMKITGRGDEGNEGRVNKGLLRWQTTRLIRIKD